MSRPPHVPVMVIMLVDAMATVGPFVFGAMALQKLVALLYIDASTPQAVVVSLLVDASCFSFACSGSLVLLYAKTKLTDHD